MFVICIITQQTPTKLFHREFISVSHAKPNDVGR